MEAKKLEDLYTLVFAHAAVSIATMRGHQEVESQDVEYVFNVMSKVRDHLEAYERFNQTHPQ